MKNQRGSADDIVMLVVIAFVASIIYLLIISVQQSRTFEIACSEKSGVVMQDAGKQSICVKTDSIIKLEIK